MQQGKAIPIVWTDEAKRISSLFVSEHEGRVTVHSIGQSCSFNIDEGEDKEAIRQRIGELLAGQPIGETFEILKREFGT